MGALQPGRTLGSCFQGLTQGLKQGAAQAQSPPGICFPMCRAEALTQWCPGSNHDCCWYNCHLCVHPGGWVCTCACVVTPLVAEAARALPVSITPTASIFPCARGPPPASPWCPGPEGRKGLTVLPWHTAFRQ